MMARGGGYTYGSARSVVTSGRIRHSRRGTKMAGPIKHTYKKRAMVKFGKERGRESFTQKELHNYMNTYVGVSGQISRQVATTKVQLTNLLRLHPDFLYLPAKEEWRYIGPLDGSDNQKQ